MNRFLSLILLAIFASSAVVISAQVPKLNSYPSASATIFLDFDGQTVNTPYWNGGTPFYCTPADFTNEQISTLFNQVAEDYRPFNLNITTDSTVYFAAPIAKRQRIIVTAYSAWYGNSGGVAYVGSFNWGLEMPGFVFSSLLGNKPKYVADACSHETGHTLGLNHQSTYDANCNFQYEYNPGTGSGEIGWAPIMGNSYSKNLSLWHNGTTNQGCNKSQDDVAIIAGSANGFGFRPDDVAATTRTATSLPVNGQTLSTTGLINNSADADIFKIVLPDKGRLTLNAIPFNTSGGYQAANIDVEVDILNSGGNVVGHYNPSASVQAVIDSVYDAGTYYVKLSNTSNANTSNYGMLGSYSVSGTFLAGATLPVHGLTLSGAASNNKHDLNWDIVADEPIQTITIEASADGKTFSNLSDISGTTRQYSYQPSEKGTVFYRLHVITASQLKYYSNVISLREVKAGKKYSLVSNLISGSNILINSNGNYNWRLLDMSGRNIATGKMANGYNNITASNLTKGMYLMQIMDGAEITTEKIVKQ